MPNKKELEKFFKSGGPIIDEHEYFNAVSITQGLWFFILLFLLVFRVEFRIDKNILSVIAGSSVDLAALTLGVLGILHEFNKRDIFFKSTLLLIAVFFAFTAFSGFITTITWIPEFEQPQVVTFWFLIVILAGDIVRMLLFRRSTQTNNRNIGTAKLGTFEISIGNGVFFSTPMIFMFLGLFGANRLSAIIALFIGGMILLLCTMLYTTLMISRRSRALNLEESNKQLEAERVKNYEKHVEQLIISIMEEIVSQRQIGNDPVKLVQYEDLAARINIQDSSIGIRDLRNAITSLIQSERLFSKRYDGPFWLPLNSHEITRALSSFNKIAMIITRRSEKAYGNSVLMELLLTKTRDKLAEETKLPKEIVDKYLLPQVFAKFTAVNSGNLFILVNPYHNRLVSALYTETDLPNLPAIIEIDVSQLEDVTHEATSRILAILNLNTKG